MKKLYLLCVVFVFVILTSCANKNNPQPASDGAQTRSETGQQLSIQDFFAYQGNTNYTYQGVGNEYASYNVSIDYIEGNRVQLRSNNGGTELVRVLENNGKEISVQLSRGECYYRENLTQASVADAEILIKEPLAKGTAWTLPDQRKRYISNLDVPVTTLVGNYKAIEITTEGKEDQTIDYYAPKIGLIKSVFKSNETEVTSTLNKIEQNKPFKQTVKFFYPNVNENKIYYVNKQLSFKTNDLTKIIFEQAYKELPQGNALNKVLGTNAHLKSLYLNNDKAVYVDFTKELISEMNAGSGYETMILQSITNTLGTYYGANKVYITVEGAPYTSGHYSFKKGEYMTVNLKDSFESQ